MSVRTPPLLVEYELRPVTLTAAAASAALEAAAAVWRASCWWYSVAVCCSVLQCDTVCCSVLQCVAVCVASYCNVLKFIIYEYVGHVAVCCSFHNLLVEVEV